MAENGTGKLKKSWEVMKAHWLLFLIFAIVVVGIALWYDLKNKGKLTSKYAQAPFFGSKFTAAASSTTSSSASS